MYANGIVMVLRSWMGRDAVPCWPNLYLYLYPSPSPV